MPYLRSRKGASIGHRATTLLAHLAFGALLLSAAPRAEAQDTRGSSGSLSRSADPEEASHRDGLWWGVGMGAGFDRFFCEICDGNIQAGWTGYLRLGGTVSPRLLLGGELSGWLNGKEEATQTMGAVSFVAYWYPSPSNVYLKGGGGVIGFRSSDGDNAVTSTTFGPLLGLGYEQLISPKVSVVPFFNVLVAPSGALRFNGDEVIDSVGFVLWQGGVGVTVH